jgi:hypothetical protein
MSVAMGGAMLASIPFHSGAIALLTVGVFACGGASSGSQTTAGTVKPTSVADPSCPVEVPGTSASVEDAGGGVSLVFVTTGDVAEVRRRAAEMARMHNDHHAKMAPLPTGEEAAGTPGHDHGAMTAGGGHDAHATEPEAGHDQSAPAGHAGHGAGRAGAGETGHEGHAGGMIGVHARATVEEVPDGARVIFISVPADAAKLRDELAMHAHHLASGTCAMSAAR